MKITGAVYLQINVENMRFFEQALRMKRNI